MTDIEIALEQGSGRPGSYDTSRLWARVARDTVEADAGLQAGGYQQKNWGRWLGTGVLTAVLAIAVVSVVYRNGIPRTDVLPTSATKTYTTLRGQRASITLADGSQVTLAPATTIKVRDRSIELNGEAVFSVINQTAKPFVVRTKASVTRVLGTTFGVRAYDNTVRIAVQNGKVESNRSVLGAGDVALIVNNKVSLQHKADVVSLLSWTTGKLVLNDVPVLVALSELSRWYDMEFEATNPELLRRQVTVTVDGPVTNDVLQAIANVLDAHMERSGRKVFFSPNVRANQ